MTSMARAIRENVYLVWDGSDEISIPPPMIPDWAAADLAEKRKLDLVVLDGRDPRAPEVLWGRMGGTTAERLTELCGRISYKSLAAEKARDSDGFHAHIREVEHGSVWEHFNFTVLLSIEPRYLCWLESFFLNRPGVWVAASMRPRPGSP